MKKIICFLMAFLLLFSTLYITASASECIADSSITLRAGGGGSGGGGGGGSGGSSGGSHHSGSNGRSSILSNIINLILLPFTVFSSTTAFYIKLTKRSRRSKKLMKKMLESDNAWKYKEISETVSDSFYAIQNAWTNMDLTPAAKYMSDELLDSFQTKLNWMAFRNQRNVLEKIELLSALPVAVYDDKDNSRDFIWFYIKGKMVDYTIDTVTQLKVEGNTSATSFIEYWQFVRRENCWVLNKILQKDEADQIPFSE